MNVVLWIIAGLLAAAFVAAGSMKLSKPRKELEAQLGGWVNDVSDAQFRGIGAIELLGGLGLVVPTLGDIAPILVPVAAVGLALTMVGAVLTHVRRGDPFAKAMPALVLGLLAAFVAVGRFGLESF